MPLIKKVKPDPAAPPAPVDASPPPPPSPNFVAPGKPKHEAYILAMDPGYTTGAFWFKDTVMSETAYREIKGHTTIWHFLEKLNPQMVVMESFHLYPTKSNAKINSTFHEVEIIGVIRVWCLLHDVPIYEQTASYAKNAISDEYLKNRDCWSVSRHCRDAARHALLFQILLRRGRVGKSSAADSAGRK